MTYEVRVADSLAAAVAGRWGSERTAGGQGAIVAVDTDPHYWEMTDDDPDD